MLFCQAKDSSLWKKIREDASYLMLREQLECMKKEYCGQPMEALKFSEYIMYSRSGSRKEYEASYFARRGRMNAFAALTLIYGEEEFLQCLEDTIWAVCDEYTWALPAHVDGTSIDKAPLFIDLFAAETGFALSEICCLLNDRLSPMLIERIKYEIDRRIISSFETTTFWWETAESNWSSVCGGSVAAAFMYMAPQRFSKVHTRIEAAMDCFLKSYREDGVCREGLGYWGYGFGFFVYYAQLLKEFTGGKTDLFKNEKVKKIAEFQDGAFLQGDVVVSFADSFVAGFRYDTALTYFLNGVYGTAIPPKAYAAGLGDDSCHRWANFIRSIVWFSAGKESSAVKKGSIYFEDSEVFIVKNNALSFAAKCGCNAEPHNHNDVGSFIFVADNRQLLCDLGAGEYTRDYFAPETRYEFLVNSSRGHNIPIVNGQHQKYGVEYGGRVICADDKMFEIDISAAYGIPTLKSLVRKFEVTENFVEITDAYEFSSKPKSVVERLISTTEPELKPGQIKLGNAVISYSNDIFDCTFRKEDYNGHKGIMKTAYLIDLKVKEPTEREKIKFTIFAQ